MAGSEDDDGEESELRLDRSELKKFMKLARNKELPFAFCPASGKDEPMFTAHKRKKPDTLGKKAKKEAEQPKYACGTMKVEGKTLTLTCERQVAGMERKLGKFLRKMKLPLEVRIADEGGEGVA